MKDYPTLSQNGHEGLRIDPWFKDQLAVFTDTQTSEIAKLITNVTNSSKVLHDCDPPLAQLSDDGSDGGGDHRGSHGGGFGPSSLGNRPRDGRGAKSSGTSKSAKGAYGGLRPKSSKYKNRTTFVLGDHGRTPDQDMQIDDSTTRDKLLTRDWRSKGVMKEQARRREHSRQMLLRAN